LPDPVQRKETLRLNDVRKFSQRRRLAGSFHNHYAPQDAGGTPALQNQVRLRDLLGCTSPTLECGPRRVYVSGRPESHNAHFKWTARACAFARTTIWDQIVKETAWRLRRIDDEKF
jgi:hypothetical protein